MASINDPVLNWSTISIGTNLPKHYIVRYKGYFWYALQDHKKVGSSVDEPDTVGGALYWGGITTLQNAIKVPLFIWTPSYTSTIQHKPDIKVIRFGNGYEQRIPQSLNSDLKSLNLNFDQRTEEEARGIIHFLKERNATKSFAYNPPDIYSETKYTTRYVCREWETNFAFKNNYGIRAKFEEVSI